MDSFRYVGQDNRMHAPYTRIIAHTYVHLIKYSALMRCAFLCTCLNKHGGLSSVASILAYLQHFDVSALKGLSNDLSRDVRKVFCKSGKSDALRIVTNYFPHSRGGQRTRRCVPVSDNSPSPVHSLYPAFSAVLRDLEHLVDQ